MKKENPNIKGRAHYQGLRMRYLNAAKDAQGAGDIILAEYNYQFAEHYGRVLAERFPNNNQQNPQNKTQDAAKTEDTPDVQQQVITPEPAPGNENDSEQLKRPTKVAKRSNTKQRQRRIKKDLEISVPEETNS